MMLACTGSDIGHIVTREYLSRVMWYLPPDHPKADRNPLSCRDK